MLVLNILVYSTYMFSSLHQQPSKPSFKATKNAQTRDLIGVISEFVQQRSVPYLKVDSVAFVRCRL